MISKIITGTTIGIEGFLIEVEVDISRGLPSFTIVGLPDKAVNESRERILSAIKNSNIEFPIKKIIINLAPAYIKKTNAILDLPIACGILEATKIFSLFDTRFNYIFLGELSLDGSIKKVKGILPILIHAKKQGIKYAVIPYSNLNEAKLVSGLNLIPVENILDLIEKLNKNEFIKTSEQSNIINIGNQIAYPYDFSEIIGNEYAKRAIEIAAAGMHNLIMVGPPGTGKTMIAKRIVTILPNLTLEEAFETTAIYSSKGLLSEDEPLIFWRPFRAPHHTSSDISIIGGGKAIQCGEVSLAHNGVLFFDEFPEFKTNVIQALREPLEEGSVTVSRASGTIKFPARFMFVAAMNPCPCGYLGSQKRNCTCTYRQIKQYYNKISGPILDRIDIQIEVNELDFTKYDTDNKSAEKSADIRKRVEKALKIQQERSKKSKNYYNAFLQNFEINEYVNIDNISKNLIKNAVEKLNLSPRAYYKILKIARTIADLEESEKVLPVHISEAIQYRFFDRKNYFTNDIYFSKIASGF
jgi:magnesium chelatase family protein